MLEHFIIRSLVELPRRIFVKAGADLRSNIVVAEKRNLQERIRSYPIHASMVRRVGYKLGGDFKPLPAQDRETGIPIRDDDNKIVLDSDFLRVLREFEDTPKRATTSWKGATVSDIVSHENLDMKPRRLVPRALESIRAIRDAGAVPLSEIADVLDVRVDLLDDIGASEFRRVVEGQDIRAIEGTVVPHFPERCWSIAERKQRSVYKLRDRDLIVGLVRPERRNIGILLDEGGDVVGSPDGLAVVRVKEEHAAEYPQEWLLAALRSEQVRLQLWTESGGTSYGKLDDGHIKRVLIPTATAAERKAIAQSVMDWIDSVKANNLMWSKIGIEGDRRPILNSPLTGLFDDDSEDDRDVEIARRRIEEIIKKPDSVIRDDKLKEKLEEWQS
jgi:type I restriction enzyme M protein